MLKSSHMKKNSLVRPSVILVAAFLGMGMSMPSCPGQQAMQQQIDTATTNNADLTRRLQSMDSQVKELSKGMTEVKSLVKPMGDAILAQKSAMDQLDANMKEMQARLMAAAKPSGHGKAPAKKHK